MNEKINKELVKIQDELSALDTAVKQIEKAETIASGVIKSIDQLQGKYSNHLEFLQKQVSELIVKNEKQLEKLFENVKEQSEEGEKQSNERLNELSDNLKKQAEEISDTFSQYHKKTVATQNENNALIKKTLEKTDSQIYQISASHNKQIDDVNELIKKYLDLAQSTAELNEEIKQIDFPVRLKNLESAAIQLNKVQVELNNDIGEKNEVIIKKLKKQNRKASTTMIFSILIFVMAAGIGLDVLLKYFPDLLSFLK